MSFLSQVRARVILALGSWASRTQALTLVRVPDDVERVADERLEQLLVHANENVPFYRGRIRIGSGNGWGRKSLSELPVLEKDDVEIHFPDEITDGSDSTDWRLMSTRGTAQRLITVHDFAKRDAGRAAWMRTFERAGAYRLGMRKVEIPPEVCEIVCGDEGEVDQSVLQHFWEMLREGRLSNAKSVRDLRGLIEREWIYNTTNYTGFGRYGSSPPDEILQRYVDRLRKDKPLVIKSLATYLVEIAKYLKRSKQALHIPILKAMGSRLSNCQRKLVEEAFGGRFWDDYGTAEFGGIACECDKHNGLHIFNDFFLVEIVDANGNPVKDGEKGWVAVTDLMNRVMPLLRYRIGDIGAIDRTPCQCGLDSPRLHVFGRAHDVVATSSKKWYSHDDLVDFCEAFPGVHCCVVESRRGDGYLLTVVPDRDVDFEEHRFKEDFLRFIDVNAQVDVRMTTTITPEPGGKFRFVRGNLMQLMRNAHGR